MSNLLRITGVLACIAAFIVGCFCISDSFLICFYAWLSGIIELLVLFAFAQHLDNQDNIIYKLQCIDNHFESTVENKSITRQHIKCESCGHTYESDRSSCPYCGYHA